MPKSNSKAKRLKTPPAGSVVTPPVTPSAPPTATIIPAAPLLPIPIPPPARANLAHTCVAALLVILSVGLYTSTIDFPWVFDDYSYLLDNPIFRQTTSYAFLSHFTEFANRPFQIGVDPDLATNYILRPFAYATFHLNHSFDGFNPRWYRVINIAIHALNSLLIFALLTTLLRPLLNAGKIDRLSWHFIPATTSLIFAAHPLAIESVTYIIQRFTSLAVTFSILSLWLHVLSLSAKSTKATWLLRSASVIALLLAMQTKECAFTIPILALLIDQFFLGSSFRSALKHSLPLLLCAPLIPILVILITIAQNHGSFSLGSAFNIVNSRDTPLDHWHYIVTQLTVIVRYLQLMAWPSQLNIDPEWPVYQSLWQKPVFLSLAFLTSLLAAVPLLLRRYRDQVHAILIGIGILWFFITISVSSGLVPLPDMMAEHRTYLPSIGIFILVAALIDLWRTKIQNRPLAHFAPLLLTTLAVVALALATTARNHVWRTNESLWKDAVAKSPGKYRTWGNLGTAYSELGKESAAIDCYRQAVKIQPHFQNGLLNLSNSCLRLNQHQEALTAIKDLIEINPNSTQSPVVAVPLGLGLMGMGHHNEAAMTFRQLLETDPNCVPAHKALGLIYEHMGIHQRALEHFQIAYRLDPSDPILVPKIQSTQNALSQSHPPIRLGRSAPSTLKLPLDLPASSHATLKIPPSTTLQSPSQP